MLVSYFETGRYHAPAAVPPQWPMPSGVYDRDAGVEAYHGMIERVRLARELGFDWVSLSEHHYSPRILTPNPAVSAAYIAARVPDIRIALLGPIVCQNNPVRLAEEFAMLDTLSEGRLVVGMLRGTANESLTYDLNPEESRERTDEGMELILKAWAEPQPFGWQGRYYRFRTVSVWPRPLQQPHPPTYALGTSREVGDFAARNHVGIGVSFGTFDVMTKATRHYREECARHGWQPDPDRIVYRANILLAETDAAADLALEQRVPQPGFMLRARVGAALLEVDRRNIAGEAKAANVNRALPVNFCGGPDRVVEQIERCREEMGAGVLDLAFQNPGSADPGFLPEALELFGRKVLPRIRDL